MPDDSARLVPEARIDAALDEIAELHEKLIERFVSAYDQDGTPVSSATPDTAARIWAALYTKTDAPAAAGSGGSGLSAAAQRSPTGAAPAPQLMSGPQGRSAYCSCECSCWRNLNEGDEGPSHCCECMDGNRPCGCRGLAGERLERVGRYTRWMPARSAAPARAPSGYGEPPPPTDDDMPFE